ncbi:MAG TPA: GNAT family N-acetyltransferase [Candidatus Binatia bacterium]|nr:GNAT family N-acetyltransferase [Candidatus Binatia bacterium]
MTDVAIRAGRDADADALIALVGACWSEYPGCVLDVDGEVPELRAIASHFARREGRFWVAERGREVVACVGCVPIVARADGGSALELLKLYVAKRARRSGLGTRLCELVAREARLRGAARIELWTDTRFADAHRLYQRLGYVRLQETRELHDRSATVELHFEKRLAAAGERSRPLGGPTATPV